MSCLMRRHCGLTSGLFFFFSTVPCYCIPHTVLNNHTIHGQMDSLVDWLYRVLLPSATVEVCSAKVTVLLPSRRASFCSVYNSCEDVTTTPVSSEVDERKSMGMLASPVLMQKREASAALARKYHSDGESSMSSSSHLRSAGRLVAMYSHKRKSRRDPRSVLETHSARERIRTEHQDARDYLKFRADEARLSDAEFHTRLLLEEQRKQILCEARSKKYKFKYMQD